MAGQGTVWRNIFGSDPDTLDQTIVAGRVTHRASERLDVSARASRIRTDDLGEFTSRIAASDQAGGGMRYVVTPFGPGDRGRRRGVVPPHRFRAQERDGSGLVGLHWLHSRGWIQVNASRFSPGESPTLNAPLPDRAEGSRLVNSTSSNECACSAAGRRSCKTSIRAPRPPPAITSRAAMARDSSPASAPRWGNVDDHLRLESGDRISKNVSGRQDVESDTGLWSADWQMALTRMNGFVRIAQRRSVTSASRSGSYTQRDVAGQIFFRMSKSAQVSAS